MAKLKRSEVAKVGVNKIINSSNNVSILLKDIYKNIEGVSREDIDLELEHLKSKGKIELFDKEIMIIA